MACGAGCWSARHRGLQNWGSGDYVTTPPFSAITDPVAAVKIKGAQSIFNSSRKYRRFVRSMNEGTNEVLDIIGIAVRGHILTADHSASAHADAPPRTEFTTATVLNASKTMKPEGLFGHQRLASVTDGSVLLVAPTAAVRQRPPCSGPRDRPKNTKVCPAYSTRCPIRRA